MVHERLTNDPSVAALRPRPLLSLDGCDQAPRRTACPQLRAVAGAADADRSGPARLGRRTKLLVRHLVRGDIALIDHLDIDRVSAEELIAAGAVAVLNCRPSSGGSYPNLGPQLLVEAGILLSTFPTTRCSRQLSDGDR